MGRLGNLFSAARQPLQKRSFQRLEKRQQIGQLAVAQVGFQAPGHDGDTARLDVLDGAAADGDLEPIWGRQHDRVAGLEADDAAS